MRYEHVHSNDISRLSSTLVPSSSHRTRIDVGVGQYKLIDSVANRL